MSPALPIFDRRAMQNTLNLPEGVLCKSLKLVLPIYIPVDMVWMSEGLPNAGVEAE